MSVYKISMPEELGVKYWSFRYPAGEVQVRILPSEIEKVKEAKEIEVTARITNGEVMELGMLSSAILGANHGARRTLILPYLPYARADRRFVDGDSFGINVFAGFINQLRYDEVRTLDIHSGASEANILNFVNIDPRLYILKAIEDIGKKDLTLLLPDAGAARYDLDDLGLPIGQCAKIRDPKTGALSGFNAPKVSTSKVLIVDDICDGGGTFAGIADELSIQDPNIVLYLYVTHGIFSKGIVGLSQRFRRVYTTDSLDQSKYIRYGTQVDLIKVVSL